MSKQHADLLLEHSVKLHECCFAPLVKLLRDNRPLSRTMHKAGQQQADDFRAKAWQHYCLCRLFCKETPGGVGPEAFTELLYGLGQLLPLADVLL